MSWRELAQALEVDTIYSINPEKYGNKDNFQNIKDKKDGNQTLNLHGVSIIELEKLAEEDWEEIKA